jgi:hypothetical protein
MENEWRSPPRPAAAPDRAILAVPADPGWEDPRLDGGEDLGGQSVEPDVGRAVAGGPVTVELGGLGLGQDIEAEAKIRFVGKPVHRGRVAVDRELERGLDLEVDRVPPVEKRFRSRGLPGMLLQPRAVEGHIINGAGFPARYHLGWRDGVACDGLDTLLSYRRAERCMVW